MEWVLLLGVALNDPEPVELARVATQRECEKAELIFLVASDRAAELRGPMEPPDLYLSCKKSPENHGSPG